MADLPGKPSKTILLLEDDLYFADFLREFLSQRGYVVTVVGNGEDGIDEMARCDFDLIVCDIVMPKLRGNLLYHALESLKPHLCSRFVFITGNRFDLSIREFTQRIGNPVLNKPFHVNELFRALAEVQARNDENSF